MAISDPPFAIEAGRAARPLQFVEVEGDHDLVGAVFAAFITEPLVPGEAPFLLSFGDLFMAANVFGGVASGRGTLVRGHHDAAELVVSLYVLNCT